MDFPIHTRNTCKILIILNGSACDIYGNRTYQRIYASLIYFIYNGVSWYFCILLCLSCFFCRLCLNNCFKLYCHIIVQLSHCFMSLFKNVFLSSKQYSRKSKTVIHYKSSNKTSAKIQYHDTMLKLIIS